MGRIVLGHEKCAAVAAFAELLDRTFLSNDALVSLEADDLIMDVLGSKKGL